MGVQRTAITMPIFFQRCIFICLNGQLLAMNGRKNHRLHKIIVILSVVVVQTEFWKSRARFHFVNPICVHFYLNRCKTKEWYVQFHIFFSLKYHSVVGSIAVIDTWQCFLFSPFFGTKLLINKANMSMVCRSVYVCVVSVCGH